MYRYKTYAEQQRETRRNWAIGAGVIILVAWLFLRDWGLSSQSVLIYEKTEQQLLMAQKRLSKNQTKFQEFKDSSEYYHLKNMTVKTGGPLEWTGP